MKRDEFASNEEFLMSCGIEVQINHNCFKESGRISELIQRSNQLNFTKVRSGKAELEKLFEDETIDCGYVTVSDKFGDYGVVGFYAIQNGKLFHYTFSCRTLGMGIEQYVYIKLGCPEIDVKEPVVTKLNKEFLPPWINKSENLSKNEKYQIKKRILIKGPCDMSQMFSFINETDDIDVEFTYVGDEGISVEGHNHTAQIVTAIKTSENRKKEILNDFKWLDKDMLTTKLSDKNAEYLILSMFTDGNLGIYKRKTTGEMIALCEKYYDLTLQKNREKYINGEIFSSNIKFEKSDLEKFAEMYEYVDNDDGAVSIRNLDEIHQFLGNKMKIILILPSENEYTGKTIESYKDRHIFHRTINKKIVIGQKVKAI